MIGKKGPELVRPVGEHEKDVWDKSRLLLHGEDTISDVCPPPREIRAREAPDGKCVSHDFGPLGLHARSIVYSIASCKAACFNRTVKAKGRHEPAQDAYRN